MPIFFNTDAYWTYKRTQKYTVLFNIRFNKWLWPIIVYFCYHHFDHDSNIERWHLKISLWTIFLLSSSSLNSNNFLPNDPGRDSGKYTCCLDKDKSTHWLKKGNFLKSVSHVCSNAYPHSIFSCCYRLKNKYACIRQTAYLYLCWGFTRKTLFLH